MRIGNIEAQTRTILQISVSRNFCQKQNLNKIKPKHTNLKILSYLTFFQIEEDLVLESLSQEVDLSNFQDETRGRQRLPTQVNFFTHNS